MILIKSLDQIQTSDQHLVGGKSLALAHLYQNGFPVPKAVCLTTHVYETFIAATGLHTRIQMEINRKDFSQMRWEEIWDAALRIRSFFLKAPIPPELNENLTRVLKPLFENAVVAVRSSAPGEDASGSSFAGLHESFVNIRGLESIIDHVRLVWASLWSDAAMLYRKEIGLDVNQSKMAVIIQEMIDGDRSGVIFTRNPANKHESVIESVHGLNQGLVDGIIEPDRWTLDIESGNILSHQPAVREKWMIAGPGGAVVDDLPVQKSGIPSIDSDDIRTVFKQAMASEKLFDYPQDMEWTFKNRQMYVLQSRPISTGIDNQGTDDRGWYLSLRRSLESLKALRVRIEKDLIVKMIEDADLLAAMDIDNLSDHDLAAEIDRRSKIYQDWEKIYWADFIPFAHGMRMFGQVYNDTIKPDDPFEFVSLLETSDLKSIERNRKLEQLAESVRHDQKLWNHLKSGQTELIDPDFYGNARHFFHEYMDASHIEVDSPDGLSEILVSILLEMAEGGIKQKKYSEKSHKELETNFLNMFDEKSRVHNEELLDLARASYRMRDDDNMFLGRIEREMKRAGAAGKQRLGINIPRPESPEMFDEIASSLRDSDYQPVFKKKAAEKVKGFDVQARQLIGQPAGQGIGTGIARVINTREDLGLFCHGEILVCDAIDPNMTLIVPMAAAIVERRGGMLIHGAIIAREYGIPCITGVPDATAAINSGDQLTVDGFLGIVTIIR